VLWRLPEPKVCPILPIAQISTIVCITIWWLDITQGFEFRESHTSIVQSQNFFNQLTYTRSTKIPASIFSSIYRTNFNETKCLEKFKESYPGYYLTTPLMELNVAWMTMK